MLNAQLGIWVLSISKSVSDLRTSTQNFDIDKIYILLHKTHTFMVENKNVRFSKKRKFVHYPTI